MHRPKRLSKHKAERMHAMRRFSERMGFGLSKEGYDDLVRQVQEGKAQFVCKQSNRVTVFRLRMDGKPVRIAYDKQRHQIVTFMPEEAEGIDVMPHPNEIPLDQLILIRADLYSQECTEEVAKKIKAIEVQINRHKEEAAEKVKAAQAEQIEGERVANQVAEADKKIKARREKDRQERRR